MPFVALLDTNALWSISVCDILLRAAEHDLYRPVWTRRILDSLATHMKEKYSRLDPARIDYRIAQMRKHFPDAEIDGYEALIAVMTNHEHDRHVLAAAVRANASVIVTDNTKHFPPESRAPYCIDVQTPDELLCHLWYLRPRVMAMLLRQQEADMSNPEMTALQVIQQLGRRVPRFAETAWVSGQFDTD